LASLPTGYASSDIEVTLSSGSVIADVSVTPTTDSTAAALTTSLDSTKQMTMKQAVLTKVKAAPSIETALATGKTLDDLAVTVSAPAVANQGPASPSPAEAKPDELADGDMAAAIDKYDFKSEKVVKLLKDLQHKWTQNKQKADIEQQNTVAQDLAAADAHDAAVAALQKSKTGKETDLGTTQGSKTQKAEASKNLKDDKKADTDRKVTVQEKCSTGRTEWETRSKTRTLEISALDMAVNILGKATGMRTKPPENPGAPTSPVSFIQTVQRVKYNDPKMAAVVLLRKAAKNTHSRALERLSVEVAAHLGGPLDKVNQMVQKMIFRLQQEQTDENEHKHWCDKELQNTETMKEDKLAEQEKLKLAIGVEQAHVTQLTTDIKDANKIIGDLNTFMKDATEIRNVGKEENRLAIKDSLAAQKAIASAVSVLNTFYKGTGRVEKEAWEFIQDPGQATLAADPALWDSPYTGVADKDNQPAGILAIISAVSQDFIKMEGDTKAQEVIDQEEFDNDMKANKIEKARRTTEVEMKSNEKKRRSDQTNSLVARKKIMDTEVDKTATYLKDLEPACGTGSADLAAYTARKENRDKEIVALRQAQTILGQAFNPAPAAAPAAAPSGFLQKLGEVKLHK